MRTHPRILLVMASTLLLICYQNFSSVSPEVWDSSTAVQVMNEMQEFQKADKTTSSLAVPSNGHDLESVGSNWARRQGDILLNGADKRATEAMNETLENWFGDGDSESTEVTEGTEVVQSQGQDVANQATDMLEGKKKKRRNYKFARINSMEYNLDEKSCLNITVDPGTSRVNYSHELAARTKLNIEHLTAGQQTNLSLRYDF